MAHTWRRATRAMRMESLESRAMLAADFQLVKDIYASQQASGLTPSEFLEVGGIAYFSGTTPTTGRELWRTDGTAEGTSLVRDINPGSGSSSPQQMLAVGSDVYFVASDGIHGQEIWKTDGTAEGTFLLKDVANASGSIPPLSLGAAGETFYFSAYDGQWGLWKSDGTTAGTAKVRAFTSTFTGAKPDHFTAIGDTLYFSADDGSSGLELWKTDGTAEGTVRVKDILPGAAGSTPTSLFNYEGTLYFAASDGVRGSELWRSDGTEAGTVLVKDIAAGSVASTPQKFLAVNGVLYFLAEDDPFHELWRTDGTAAGTVKVYGAVRELIEFQGTLYAFSSGSIVRTDGTPAGTEVVANYGAPFFGAELQPTVAGEFIYFVGHSTAAGNEVWVSDGTPVGTHILKDLNTTGLESSNFFELSALGDALLFRAYSGLTGQELWTSDGAEAGTRLVRPPAPRTASSDPRDLTEFGGGVYFFAADANGEGLWRSDGTLEGTTVVRYFQSGLTRDHRLTAVNGLLYFVANDGTTGNELWKSDGSSAGTEIVKEIVPGTNGSFSSLTEQEFLASAGDLLYFTIIRSNKTELWKSDGSTAGTLQLKTFDTALASNVSQLTEVNGQLFFVGYEPSTGRELWKSDGTPEGTVRLSDIWPGPGDSIGSPGAPMLFNVGGTVLFAANHPATGRELWRWDEVGGVALVKDAVPGTGSSIAAIVDFLLPSYAWAVAGGNLYFASNAGLDQSGGIMELWKSDGTADGTMLVKDIRPGRSGGFPEQLTAVGNVVYFTADDGVNGRELWTSDGTEAGTYIVREFEVGPLYRPISILNEAGGKLYFTVSIDGIGDELWSVDGANGAQLVGDLTGDGGGSAPGEVTIVGNRLYLAATTDATGRELWTLDLGGGATIAGDYDGNSIVDGADFLAWQRNFGAAVAPHGDGEDGNANGAVDAGDLAVWKSNFGQTTAVEPPTEMRAASVGVATDEEAWVVDALTTDDASPTEFSPRTIDQLFAAGDLSSLFAAEENSHTARRRPLSRLLRT